MARESCMDFDKLECIIEIRGTLVNTGPLHVGTAAAEAQMGMDNPVEKGIHPTTLRETPYIPGSSLKGSLRSTAERLVRSGLLEGEGVWACDPFSEKDRELEDEEGPCLICQIFGGGGRRRNRVASHVAIYDAFPLDPEEARAKIKVRTRVAISRLKGGAAGGRLFNIELVQPGVKWEFRMRITNIDLRKKEDNRAKLLKMLLRWLRDGLIQVGGGRSVGLGAVKLEEARVTIYSVRDGRLEEEHMTLDELLGGE